MRQNRKLIILIMLFIMGFGLYIPRSSGGAISNHQLDLKAVDTFLLEKVKANRIPGLAVAIVQDDKVIFSKGYGQAEPGKPVTERTQFYIGSVTKSFTALATMQLVEQGKLELDIPVQQYLPWFQVADSEASTLITVRQLLNHTSGLSEKGDPHASTYTSSLEEQGRLLKDAHPTAPVGTQYQYFNQNYRLLGLLIEQVTGQSYGEYLQDHIFDPLGMPQTTTDPAEASNLAQGYSRAFGFSLPQSQSYNPGGLPSGYLVSTASDMAQFLIAQINNQDTDGNQMLDPQLLTTMRTLPEGIQSEYGMGWMVMEDGNMLAHGGALDYFQSFMVIRPKEKLGMVILYNQNSMENMLFENNSIRNGLINLLSGKSQQQISYGWIGWVLLALAFADIFNHVRLFSMSPGWVQKTSTQNHTWLRVKVVIGILIPLFVIFGLPLMVKTMQGGTPTWAEPFRLQPDLTVWLLLGMSLNFVRNLLYALALLRRQKQII